MRTVITGGAGFLGVLLTRHLLAAPDSAEDPAESRRIVIADRAPTPVSDDRVVSVDLDLCGPDRSLVELVSGAEQVVHLAAVVSADAEAAPERAWLNNVDASRRLLEACGVAARGCRFVATSSVAVFAGDPEPSGDRTRAVPASTYGMTKAMLELLVNEATRRGMVDGRTARLPTVIVRPGRPNLAASSFASGVFREPFGGVDAVVPVGPEVAMVVIGHRAAVAGLAALAAVPAARLGADRAINLPGLEVTVGELVEASRRVAARRGIRAGAITVAPDAAIEAIVASWPGRWVAGQAQALGLPADRSLDAIAEDYLDDFGPGRA
jgi:nucleoside-diphosphate-sugar epimerase